MERFSGLGADFVYNLFPTLCTAPGMNLRSGTGRDTNPPIDPRKAVWAQRSAASLPKFSAADFFVRFMYLFPAVLGLHCRVGAFLWGEREPLSGCAAWVSHCGGFSCGAAARGCVSFSSRSHRLSCLAHVRPSWTGDRTRVPCIGRWIFNPLNHQGSPSRARFFTCGCLMSRQFPGEHHCPLCGVCRQGPPQLVVAILGAFLGARHRGTKSIVLLCPRRP